MADTKISALTAATTPLAGTEVLPIVQSGATVKVANNDLRPKQIQSNATSGVLQVAGPAAAATRVMTVPDANFTAARTDAANNFTGAQTLSTDNLIQGTAGKGINFTANTAAAGKTSQLLNWYEEGTWTPVVSDALTGGNQATLSSSNGKYTRLGRQVTVSCRIVFSSISGMSTGNVLYVQGLPFTPGNALADRYTSNALLENITFTNNPYFVLDGNGAVFYLAQNISGGAATQIKVSQAANNTFIAGSITYFV